MSRRASFARSSDSSRLLKRAKASTFLRAPSSSRTLERMCLAMKNAMSSDSSTESASAFFSTIATRISSSGGSMATVRPTPKREIRRSSMPAISFG